MPDFSSLLKQLSETASKLTITRLMLLDRMASALCLELSNSLNPSSDLATLIFVEYFAARLLIHHAVVEEKLNKKAFEYIFRDALRNDGKNAYITSSDVHPGADLIVNNIRISLKTEASKSIRETKITISKFMEARWIRNENAIGLAQLASERIREHLAGYDRIFMLRSFNTKREEVRYELVEIPHSLLNLASCLEPRDILLSLGRSGGGSTTIRLNNQEAFTLKFDGSVEKLTITNLSVDLCTSHATWNVPLISLI